MNQQELSDIRQAGKIVADVLQMLVRLARPGVLTMSLDRAAEFRIKKLGGEPACKGYKGFPASVCISVNDEIIHGIPDGRPLKTGDIVSFDTVVKYGSMHADAAVTVPVGEVPGETLKLLQCTRTALYRAIELCKPDMYVMSLSLTIESEAITHGFIALKEFGGHGIGKEMHEAPFIANGYADSSLTKLRAGQAVAIEPMFMTKNGWSFKPDGWTVVGSPGSLSAHFEHTVLITESGHEILTEWAEAAQLTLPKLLR